MTFHYMEFLTYCHATEDPSKVKEALHVVTLNEVDWGEEKAEGYHGNPILIIKGKLSRNREMDEVFKNLPKETVESLLREVERRIDDDCNFFFRIDKSQAYLGTVVLSNGDNTIRVRARVESYPAKRETAVEKIKEYLDGLYH
ncbi:MAG: RNA-binding domain-containing protein [Thermoplasmata archaeon]